MILPLLVSSSVAYPKCDSIRTGLGLGGGPVSIRKRGPSVGTGSILPGLEVVEV